jgi:hypothetical protein
VDEQVAEEPGEAGGVGRDGDGLGAGLVDQDSRKQRRWYRDQHGDGQAEPGLGEAQAGGEVEVQQRER